MHLEFTVANLPMQEIRMIDLTIRIWCERHQLNHNEIKYVTEFCRYKIYFKDESWYSLWGLTYPKNLDGAFQVKVVD
jgi:hypothetical protein